MSQGKRHVSACLLLAALASAPQMSVVADDSNGVDTIARIIGGRDADANSWPSLVALVRSGTFTLKDRFFCGATVVAERWAMTAAHCVYDAFGRVVQPSSLRVVAGVRNLENDVPNEETIVSNIIVHPDYDNTNNLPPNDIALLELATAIDAPVVNLFPGETEDDFKQLLDFIDEAQLDRVGAFTYSPVEGAPANQIEGHVPEEVKEQRLVQFMNLQASISTNKLTKKVGKTIDVIIDEVDDEGAVARSKADAPEIDGLVYLNGETNHKVGDIVSVTVHASDEHDLWANS